MIGEKWILGKDMHLRVFKRGRVAFEIIEKICPKAQILAFIDTYKKGTYLEIPIK